MQTLLNQNEPQSAAEQGDEADGRLRRPPLIAKPFDRLEVNLATLREYFDTDVKQLCSQTEWNTQDQTGKVTPSLAVKAVLDLEANAKHLRFFIPAGADPLSYTNMILASSMTARCLAHEEGDLVTIRSGFADYERMDSKTLVFTRSDIPLHRFGHDRRGPKSSRPTWQRTWLPRGCVRQGICEEAIKNGATARFHFSRQQG